VNKEKIIKRVISIIEQGGPIPKQTLDEKLSYRYLDAGHIDSFGITRLIFSIEDEFGIELSPDDTPDQPKFVRLGIVRRQFNTKFIFNTKNESCYTK
jgi:acyl carrier protein